MDANTEMLNYVCQNADMGQKTLSKLVNTADTNNSFSALLNSQLSEYKQIYDTAWQKLRESGEAPKETPSLKKASAYLMLDLKTMGGKTDPDHISEMLIQGSTMGVIQLTRRMREFEGQTAPEINDLAGRLLATEQRNIDECKKFLQ